MIRGARCVKASALAANRRTEGTTTTTGDPADVVDSVLEWHPSEVGAEAKEASIPWRDAAAEPASSAPAIRVVTILVVMVQSSSGYPGLPSDGRTADLVLDQEAARVANVELGSGLAVFDGDLDRSLLGGCGAGSGQQGYDRHVAQGIAQFLHGPAGGDDAIAGLQRGIGSAGADTTARNL